MSQVAVLPPYMEKYAKGKSHARRQADWQRQVLLVVSYPKLVARYE